MHSRWGRPRSWTIPSRILSKSSGRGSPDGADVVIDLVGIPDLLVAVVAVLKPGGRVTSTVLPPEMQGVAGLGIEGKTTARYTADHRFPEIAVRIAEGSLRIPAIQAFPFDHIQDAVALQATRHVRGKIAVQIGLIAHAEVGARGSRSPRSVAGL